MVLNCHCGENVKYELISKTCFKENNMGLLKNLSNHKLLEKIMSSSYHMN